MAQYNITHRCGHDQTHDIVGTNVQGQRERKAEYLATTLCTECYRAEKQAEAKVATADLPALTGSEKQIEWAETLRAKMIKDAADWTSVYDGGDELLTELKAQSNAKWWIDNRNKSGDDLAKIIDNILGGFWGALE